MEYHFMAMMARMKYIERWALMRNSEKENISEHSMEVAMIAHTLAVISNVRCEHSYNVERVALLALYHDTTEIITGDMPTPIKYYNPDIKTAFQEVENIAANRLLEMLPDDYREYYDSLYHRQEEERELWRLVKAADRISALVKCIEERKAGNHEFIEAESTIRDSIEKMNLPEVSIYFEEFLPSYEKSLDGLKIQDKYKS